MNKIVESFTEQGFDIKLGLDILDFMKTNDPLKYEDALFNDKMNIDITSQVNEIKKYISFLVDDQKLHINTIYACVAEWEMQRLYNLFTDITIDFFQNQESYDLWKKYIMNGNHSVYISDITSKDQHKFHHFDKLSLEELEWLERFFWKESYQQIWILKAQKYEDERILDS